MKQNVPVFILYRLHHMEPRGLSFNDAKQAEQFLQQLCSKLDCCINIEPISGTDMLYTDGMASRSNFKITFTRGAKEVYKVFYPPYTSWSKQEEFDEKIKIWVDFIEKTFRERPQKVTVATRMVPISHPEEIGENGLLWRDVSTNHNKT